MHHSPAILDHQLRCNSSSLLFLCFEFIRCLALIRRWIWVLPLCLYHSKIRISRLKGDDTLWFYEETCIALARHCLEKIFIIIFRWMLWAATFPTIASSRILIKILHLRGLFQSRAFSCGHKFTKQVINSPVQWEISGSQLKRRQGHSVITSPSWFTSKKPGLTLREEIYWSQWPSANNTFICSRLCEVDCLLWLHFHSSPHLLHTQSSQSGGRGWKTLDCFLSVFSVVLPVHVFSFEGWHGCT